MIVNIVQPDARIRQGNGPVVGDNEYNTDAHGQSRSARVPNRGTATFRITVQNDGTAVDTFRLSGPGSTNRYVVTYELGTTNITAGVVAGTQELVDVFQGSVRTVTVTVRARRGTPVGAAITRRVTATSVLADRRDTVRFTVTRR